MIGTTLLRAILDIEEPKTKRIAQVYYVTILRSWLKRPAVSIFPHFIVGASLTETESLSDSGCIRAKLAFIHARRLED